jgi:hypothetical protein
VCISLGFIQFYEGWCTEPWTWRQIPVSCSILIEISLPFVFLGTVCPWFSSKYMQVCVIILFRFTIHSDFFVRMEDVFWIRPVIVCLGHCVGLHTYLCVRQFCYIWKNWVIDRIQLWLYSCCLNPHFVYSELGDYSTWNSFEVSFA